MGINYTGTVESIYLARAQGELPVNVGRAIAIDGQGLAGDRYATGNGYYSNSTKKKIRHVALIGSEAIERANSKLEQPFSEAETRRNIVTRDINLNDLIGQEFTIGGVLLRGNEPCDPCRRPDVLSGKRDFAAAFAGIGGLRAEVLSSGLIICGDLIIAKNQYVS